MGLYKYYLYHITEIRDLKKKTNESVSNYSKVYNTMFNKMPAKNNPIDTSAKLTYPTAFDAEFSLYLQKEELLTM